MTEHNEVDKEIPILSRLSPPSGAVRNKKRVGRGPGSGLGKTAGRGQKGQKSRSTGSFGKLGFEGGQMPLQRRLPKVGFRNPFARRVAVVNLTQLQAFDKERIALEDWRAARLLRRKHDGIKLLAVGEVSRAFTVEVHACSAAARAKIEAAGGRVELVATDCRKRSVDPKHVEAASA